MLTRNRFVLLAFLLFVLPLFAQREPVLKQIDLPHSYYYREMYLPQLTTGPSAAAWTPDSGSADLLHGGSAVATRAEFLRSRAIDCRAGIRLSAGLFAGWALGDLRFVCQRRHGAVVARPATPELATTHSGGAVNVEPRFLTRRQASRVRFHFVQRALPYLCRATSTMAN